MKNLDIHHCTVNTVLNVVELQFTIACSFFTTNVTNDMNITHDIHTAH